MQRYHLLNLANAIIYIQRILYKEETETKKEKIKNTIYPFNKTWLDKSLTLNSAVTSPFLDKQSFDLSDCGTHLLEHLFGMIRRFCAGDDSQDKFDQSIDKAIFVRKCISDLHLSGYIPGRVPQD